MSCSVDATAESMCAPVPSGWDASQIPSLQGKLAIVTGANSGIGFVTALELARKGAHVVLACRNEQKGTDAAQKIRDELAINRDNVGETKVEFMQLDVSDLSSVKRFADTFKAQHARLDLLINNAGIMAVPHSLTVDGYESQFATNHLGHFALTAQLFDLIKNSAPTARVVNVSSVMHRFANMKEDEILVLEKNYRPLLAYCNSKLCNLLFSFELTKRLRASAANPGVTVATCHPGYTSTNLLGPPGETLSWIGRTFWSFANKMPIGQAAETGALPTLYAATAPGVQSGDYYGPKWCFGLFGIPVLEEPSKHSKSKALAAKLWEESERLANVSFNV